MNNISLNFAPLIPFEWLMVLAAIALTISVTMLVSRQKGALLRLVAFGLILLSLFNPSLINEDREKLRDVVAVLVDKSGSQTLVTRAKDTEKAKLALVDQIGKRNFTDIRTIEVNETDGANDGTRLFDALKTGLNDVPSERLAGIITITDGQAHDVPPTLKSLGFAVPFHALITGTANEIDRRIEVIEAPRFGLVGKDQAITFMVTEHGKTGGTADITIKRDGKVIQQLAVKTGIATRLSVKIDHAGSNLFEIEIAGIEGELTLLNNTALVTIDGVRDTLKVLLVSGEPNAGERTWRNFLKADANVDLVHFTILRPPEKQAQDSATAKELSLIQFPTRELFQQKIGDFDLIIFDRYSNQTILPSSYFDNIAKYVQNGGALLIAAGPEFGAPGGLQTTSLKNVIPVATTGQIVEQPFLARVTQIGKRHPVTHALTGDEVDPPNWAPWFRLIGAEAKSGSTIMSGPDNGPLLVLSREGKGRVGLFLSDQTWLWARGYGEGGPYLDLLRRLSHWLMKEPELEEEALRLAAKGGVISISRQTLAEKAEPVTLTSPDGSSQVIELTQAEAGIWRGTVAVKKNGLYKANDSKLTALVNMGSPNPREFQNVVSNLDILQPIAAETGGSVRRLNGSNGFVMPRIVDISTGSRFAGSDYIGLRSNNAYVVKGVGLFALTAGLLGLVLLLVGVVLAWMREGRGFLRASK
jgi:hypothetical protein